MIFPISVGGIFEESDGDATVPLMNRGNLQEHSDSDNASVDLLSSFLSSWPDRQTPTLSRLIISISGHLLSVTLETWSMESTRISAQIFTMCSVADAIKWGWVLSKSFRYYWLHKFLSCHKQHGAWGQQESMIPIRIVTYLWRFHT